MPIPLLLLVLLLPGCDSGKAAPPVQRAAPVKVGEVERGAINRSITAVGNVYPSLSVDIKPRVAGEILEVYFTEGQDVKEGQPILQIDPRPYAADLAEKRANLAKSEAQLTKARHDRTRYGKLVNDGYVSRETFEQTATDAAAIAATVEADKAAVERAALELSYCNINAPIGGRIGELKMHKGNMVKSGDSDPVATIDTISPCYVSFSVPEVHLPTVLEKARNGEMQITASPVGGQGAVGRLTLVDNRVDTKTGSIRLRATFPNENRILWPGQFVEVQVPLGELVDTLIVPTLAVQRGREENFLYVAKPDNTAEYRSVKPLFESGGKTAVEGNVKPGEKVIIDGQVRLAPGVAIKILP